MEELKATPLESRSCLLGYRLFMVAIISSCGAVHRRLVCREVITPQRLQEQPSLKASYTGLSICSRFKTQTPLAMYSLVAYAGQGAMSRFAFVLSVPVDEDQLVEANWKRFLGKFSFAIDSLLLTDDHVARL